MTSTAMVTERPPDQVERSQPEVRVAYRLRPVMRQGTASGIQEVWQRFESVADARQAAHQMYRDDRVARVFVVTDTAPPEFVEWIDR